MKRIKLVLALVAAMAVMIAGTLPAFAQGQAECGLGANVSRFSSEAGKSGNGKQNGEFASESAQNSDPNFGQELSEPTGATKCAQN